MKKRTIPLLLASALLLVLAVFAANGTEHDPLLSVSYLMDVLFPQMEEEIKQEVAEQNAPILEGALSDVNEIGGAALENQSAPVWSYSGQYEILNLKVGDTVSLSVGSGVLWLKGTGTASAGLVCVSNAQEPEDGADLETGHRYLNGGEGAVTVTILSDAAQLAVEGRWLLTESEETPTWFYDLVPSRDWFYSGVRFVIERELFFGVSDTEFSPLTNMDRSMLACILYRMEGSPEIEYNGTFSDIEEGRWYTTGIEWAASKGFVSGVGDGSFRPTDPLTREQIASMLYRFAGLYLGLDVSEQGDLSVLEDGDSVSFWAETSMRWAVAAGITDGVAGETLLPRNNANRAEVACMLSNFLLWVEVQS